VKASCRELIGLKLFSEPTNVSSVIHLLPAAELRTMMRGTLSSTSSMSHEALIQHAKSHFSKQRTIDGRALMPKALASGCVRISLEMTDVVKRMHRLFFMNQSEDHTPILMVSLGKVKFPRYLLHSNSSTGTGKSLSAPNTQEDGKEAGRSPGYGMKEDLMEDDEENREESSDSWEEIPIERVRPSDIIKRKEQQASLIFSSPSNQIESSPFKPMTYGPLNCLPLLIFF